MQIPSTSPKYWNVKTNLLDKLMCHPRPRWFSYTLLEYLGCNKLCLSQRKQVISVKSSPHIKELSLLSHSSHIFLQNNLISQITNQVNIQCCKIQIHLEENEHTHLLYNYKIQIWHPNCVKKHEILLLYRVRAWNFM